MRECDSGKCRQPARHFWYFSGESVLSKVPYTFLYGYCDGHAGALQMNRETELTPAELQVLEVQEQ